MPIIAYFCCKLIFYKYTKPSELDAAAKQVIKALVAKVAINSFFVMLYLRLAAAYGLLINEFVATYVVVLMIMSVYPMLQEIKKGT